MSRSLIVLTAALLFVTACAPWSRQSAKETKLAAGYYLTPQIEWSAMKEGPVRTWTVHGPPLESLSVVSALADGKPLRKPASRKEEMPLFRASMTASEVAELVVETLLRTGYGGVELVSVRPEPFGGKSGFRFELSLVASNGLEHSGFGAGAVVEEKLYLVLFRAPRLHYFDAYRETVEQLIASVRFH